MDWNCFWGVVFFSLFFRVESVKGRGEAYIASVCLGARCWLPWMENGGVGNIPLCGLLRAACSCVAHTLAWLLAPNGCLSSVFFSFLFLSFEYPNCGSTGQLGMSVLRHTRLEFIHCFECLCKSKRLNEKAASTQTKPCSCRPGFIKAMCAGSDAISPRQGYRGQPRGQVEGVFGFYIFPSNIMNLQGRNPGLGQLEN